MISSGRTVTVRDYLRAQTVIFFALVFGQVVFAGAVIFLSNQAEMEKSLSDLKTVFYVVNPTFLLASYFGARTIFNVLLNSAKSKDTLSQKLIQYRKATILRFALIESSTFFALIVFLLTGDYIFIGVALLSIGVFITFKRNKEQIVTDLELSLKEEEQFNNPEEIVSVNTISNTD